MCRHWVSFDERPNNMGKFFGLDDGLEDASGCHLAISPRDPTICFWRTIGADFEKGHFCDAFGRPLMQVKQDQYPELCIEAAPVLDFLFKLRRVSSPITLFAKG
ncbi:hypothetical protein TNIN_7401 [Trichonephila inaurata madagascariensis]|uniref:Uncharacterized protein n=1 Tax=Trichonephila inaurata madagascariensis TaxID=2747483 RepID=A0A8X6WSF3_9ARAC|nr:hypothetical protein TNIN_7401 [Trichonephila inaurata madagascariensis]